MALFALFCFGIANFAMHKAVLESGHPLLGALGLLGGRISLTVEFVMLAGCMLMAQHGATSWTWGYLAYSIANALAAWLILTGRS